MPGWINWIRNFSGAHYVVTSGDVIQPNVPPVKDQTQLERAHEQL